MVMVERKKFNFNVPDAIAERFEEAVDEGAQRWAACMAACYLWLMMPEADRLKLAGRMLLAGRTTANLQEVLDELPKPRRRFTAKKVSGDSGGLVAPPPQQTQQRQKAGRQEPPEK